MPEHPAKSDHTAIITDHPFTPPPDRPWDRCVLCGLAQPSHARVPEPYVPDAPRARPARD